jgi:CubicO group peptidase (beta-lactamase class C family)
MLKGLLGCAAFSVVVMLPACNARPGSPDGSFAPSVPFAAAPQDAKISIEGPGSSPALDKLVVRFMVAAQVPNAQLGVSVKGKTTFSHAYTYRELAKSTTHTNTIMRLASNTKAWVDGALYNLIEEKKIDPQAKVFAYLGITKPLPKGVKVDKRVYDITIEDMILHESGWDDSVPPHYDPTFKMREIALALHLKKAVGQVDYVRYQLGKPLQEPPGTKYAYCNFCYTVLGMVIAKASGMPFGAYIAKNVAGPLGLHNVLLSPTVGARLQNEVAKYYSAYRGLSALYVLSNKRYPYPYSGDDMVLEVAGGAAEIATNANSMLAFMNEYLIWGVGTPQPGADWAREGSMPGTNTWAEQLPNGSNYSFLVNTRQYIYGRDPNAFESLQYELEKRIDPQLDRSRQHRMLPVTVGP